MKNLFPLGILACTLPAFADDGLLKNADFATGVNEWDGPIHTAGSASDDSGATSGAVVKLGGEWTKVNQDFDATSGAYRLTIKYTVSPDFAPSKRRDDYVNVPGQLGLTILNAFNTEVGKFLIIVQDLGAWKYTSYEIAPSKTAKGVQTFSAMVHLASDDQAKKGFFMGFPPGKGSINFLSISLTDPKKPATPSTP